jgi:hypothetical protein
MAPEEVIILRCMRRRCGWHIVACALIIMVLYHSMAPRPTLAVEPVYFYASQTGRPTLDKDDVGGNPFASALVELLAHDMLTFESFREQLVNLTYLKSRGFQRPEVFGRVDKETWQLLPKPSGERRVALVLVFSDYSAYDAANSLPGAKHDMYRVAGALDRAGFEVQSVVDPYRTEIEIVLRKFAVRSAEADVAVIYTTGHGVEVEGAVYLLPGNYPLSQGSAALKERAVRLNEMGSALRARHANLVFYGGCRNNPFSIQ